MSPSSLIFQQCRTIHITASDTRVCSAVWKMNLALTRTARTPPGNGGPQTPRRRRPTGLAEWSPLQRGRPLGGSKAIGLCGRVRTGSEAMVLLRKLDWHRRGRLRRRVRGGRRVRGLPKRNLDHNQRLSMVGVVPLARDADYQSHGQSRRHDHHASLLGSGGWVHNGYRLFHQQHHRRIRLEASLGANDSLVLVALIRPLRIPATH
jgi:hypothetical protein